MSSLDRTTPRSRRFAPAVLGALALGPSLAGMGAGFGGGQVIALGATLALGAGLLGCEESTARAQAAAQREIDEVADAFRMRSLGTPFLADGEAVAREREELGRLLARLTSLSGATPGQQAAANSLGAQIATTMGQLSADRLSGAEAELRKARAAVAPRIDAAIRLGVLADAMESFDPSKDRALLDRLRAEATDAINASRQRVGELEKPVADLIRDNETSRALLADLDRDEAALRSQARGAGPIAGFRFVEQAAQKRTEADAIRVRIARNEVQLAELAPEQALATLDAEQSSQIVQTLDGAKADLGSLSDRSKELAGACRAEMGAIRDQLASTAALAEAALVGPMAALLTEAQQDFEKAAQLAQRGASSDAGREGQAAARSAVGSAQQSLAEVNWGFALAAGDQAAFLERVAAVPGLAADPAALRSAASTLLKTRDEAVERAKAAASAALETVGQSGTDSPETTALKANLTSLLDAMSGKAISTGGSSLAGAPSADAPGFESPEALLDFLQKMNAAPPEPGTIRAMAFAYRASSSQGRPVQNFLAIMHEDGAEFASAVIRKFGMEATRESGGADLLNDPSKLKVGEIKESKATLDPTEPGVKGVPLVKAGGRWYIDVDGLLATRVADMQELTAAAKMLQQAGPMLEQFRKGIRSAASAVATRVKAGEFASPQEAQAAFQSAIQEQAASMMQEAMGGLQDALKNMSPEEMKKLQDAAQEAMKNMSPEDIKKLQEQMKNGQVPAVPGK